MGMKRHMLICSFISMLVDREKSEVVIKWRYLLKKVRVLLRKFIRKGSSFFLNEIVRLENKIIIF